MTRRGRGELATDVDLNGLVIGSRWLVGSTELEVSQPRLPCFKLGLAFRNPQMVRAFALARKPGAYLRIVREGELGAGDAIEVVDRPAHGVTVALVSAAILLDDSLRARAATAPELARGLAKYLRQDDEAAA